MADGIKTSAETAAAALAGSELIRGVQSGGNVKITADQLKTFTHQGNLPFPATQVPSADANTLDDYEEGTFTFSAVGDGTNNYTLSNNDNAYTKIGDMATYWIDVDWTSIGSAGAGQLRAAGLPFTSTRSGAMNWGQVDGMDTGAGVTPISAFCSSSTLFFRRINDNAASTTLPANSSSASGGFSGSLCCKI